MPNIHFLGKSGSRAISVMGISLYRMTASAERERAVVLRKSSSASIMARRPVTVRLVGSWKGRVGIFSSSKRMERMYSFRSNSSSLVRKEDTSFSGRP